MSHTSPATYLVWSIMGIILFAFLVFHMWSFDRFKCLRWNNGPYSGAFKRVMTYSYLLSVPLLLTYSIGFAIIKYKEGFIVLDGAIIPKPYTMWPESSRRAIFPLMLTFTLGWSMEMITHLEELCFWLFLVNSGSVQQDWFRSWYFRTWIFGSCIAVIYMPLLTILTRSDPLKSEAYTFLGGESRELIAHSVVYSDSLGVPCFLGQSGEPNLYSKSEGVDTGTIVRLTKFHELNLSSASFFVVPFVILGADGVRDHVHINESMLWTDFLTMISAFGCSISSAITLVIFFPRSIEGEIAAKDAARARRRNRSYGGNPTSSFAPDEDMRYSQYTENGTPDLVTSSNKQRYSFPPPSQDGRNSFSSPQLKVKEWSYDGEREIPELHLQPALRPNRRRGGRCRDGWLYRPHGGQPIAAQPEPARHWEASSHGTQLHEPNRSLQWRTTTDKAGILTTLIPVTFLDICSSFAIAMFPVHMIAQNSSPRTNTRSRYHTIH
ncbi:hypothetical protein MVEN_00597700 [Mycena venus]|uniref:Uncharacterized protein n=1 Tax=Mycena venus TaxID=2733690 RepID=A0A8H7D5T7_9AGAR|nr:hypothetical protein MVEN_00597700 [Mycena venus]